MFHLLILFISFICLRCICLFFLFFSLCRIVRFSSRYVKIYSHSFSKFFFHSHFVIHGNEVEKKINELSPYEEKKKSVHIFVRCLRYVKYISFKQSSSYIYIDAFVVLSRNPPTSLSFAMRFDRPIVELLVWLARMHSCYSINKSRRCL